MATEAKKRRPGRPRNPIARETLLQLSLQAFAQRGYAGASMAEIARSAGLRKASLFHHFTSKEALYLEVLQGIAAGLGQLISQASLHKGPFQERLDRLGTLATDYFGSNPGAARVLLRELLDSGPYYEGPGSQAIRLTLESIAAFMQAGMLQGEIPYQDPHHLALSIASVHLTYFSLPHVCGELLEADIFTPTATDARRTAVLEQARRMSGVAQ
jgi:TetR/AcrR family transcriptional regulator